MTDNANEDLGLGNVDLRFKRRVSMNPSEAQATTPVPFTGVLIYPRNLLIT